MLRGLMEELQRPLGGAGAGVTAVATAAAPAAGAQAWRQPQQQQEALLVARLCFRSWSSDADLAWRELCSWCVGEAKRGEQQELRR